MADKTIGQLPAASQVTPTDLLVLEQSGTAKKLTGQTLENWLLTFADGHGGIQSIEKTGTSGLTDTYTITLSDTTTVTLTVHNGKGISSVTTYYAVSSSGSTVPSNWSTTRQSMTATNRYLWSYQRIAFNDNTNTDTVKTVIGVYGDKGDKGDTGNTGNGIASLAQTGRIAGEYTTYTFTMTNGSTESFEAYDGVGITGVVAYYAVSSSDSTPPSTWYQTRQNMTSENRYLWSYQDIQLSNNTNIATPKVVIGVYGDKGDKGDPGEVTQAEFDDLKSDFREEIDGVISASQIFTASANGGEMQINAGGITANGADNNNQTNRCRTRYFDVVGNRRYMVKLLSANYVMINSFQYGTPPRQTTMLERIYLADDRTIIFNTLENAHFVRISFARVDDEAITEEDRANILDALRLYSLTDATLTQSGAAADAKATGDRLTALESFASGTGVTVNGETVDIDVGTLASGYMDTATGIKRSSSSGLGVTDYIDISEYAKIAFKRIRSTSATAASGTCFYDSNQSWIGGIVSLRSQPAAGYDDLLCVADIPDGAHYVRFTGYIDTATYGDFVVKGIKPSIPNDISNVARVPQIGNIFCVSSTLPNIQTFTDVFAAYDELVANYPLIMSKSTLTIGSFSNYEYVFSTGNYNTKGNRARDSVITKPKILVTSGTHGAERSAVISLYNFVKAMCENAYTLNDVINPVEYRIIPVVCPWGYDENSRTNENGVNINRNFATSDWTQTATGDDYSGASAGDQIETQIVQNWLTANNDAEIYIDFHNSGYADEISALIGLSTQTHMAAKMCYLQSVNEIIPYLKNARNLGQYNVFAYTGNTDIPGTAKGYGEEHGIMSFTLETSNNVENHGKYGAFVNAVGCEMFGATMKGMVKYVLS